MTDVKRLLGRSAQDAEKNKTAMKQDVAEFDAAMGKVAAAMPAISDLSAPMKALKTWIEAAHADRHRNARQRTRRETARRQRRHVDCGSDPQPSARRSP